MSTASRLSLKSGNGAAGGKRQPSKPPPMKKSSKKTKVEKQKRDDDEESEEEDVVMVEPELFDEDTHCAKCAVSFRSVASMIVDCCMTLRHIGFWTAFGFRQLYLYDLMCSQNVALLNSLGFRLFIE